uniref:Sarcospan n=1 Tax=Cacopsylla melanoneura TaxID=428564 RepID=A0A8D8V3X7_9HEMI
MEKPQEARNLETSSTSSAPFNQPPILQSLPKQSISFPISHKSRRPVSFYDNWNSNGGPNHPTKNTKTSLKRSRTFHDPPDSGRSPSLAYTLNTTVPQCLRGSVTPERHVPTRSSLRHSRLIVLKQSSKVPHKYLPPIIRYHRVAKKLVILQFCLGIVITCLAVWLVRFCNTLYARDTPYWSGIPLILAAISAYILLYCCRKEYPGMHLNCYIFLYKVSSICLSLLASMLCFTAAIFCLFHVTFLSYSICNDTLRTVDTDSTSIKSYGTVPSNIQMDSIHSNVDSVPRRMVNSSTTGFNSKTIPSCSCEAHTTGVNSLVKTMLQMTTPEFLYRGVSCTSIRSELTFVMLCSGILNGIAGIVLFYYVYLHWKSRYLYVYSYVDSGQTKPSVITNKS